MLNIDEKIKNTVTDISSISKQLKSHYYNNEFFVDPEKQFINLLDKLIKYFDEDEVLLLLKQNEDLSLQLNQLQKDYDEACEFVSQLIKH